MAITWGAWKYDNNIGNGMRVGVEPSWSAVNSGSAAVTASFKVYTQNRYAYQDFQELVFSGTAGSGSFSYNNQGPGSPSPNAPVLRTTRTYTYSYASGQYGTSPGSRTFTATVTGAFNGVVPSVTVTTAIPARPYSAPATPSNVTATRNSDAEVTLNWTRNATAAAPYSSQLIEMATFSGSTWSAWTSVGTVSGTATSYVKTGLSANRVYSFRIRSQNSAGNSGYATASPTVYMTPAAPSNVTAAMNSNGTSITLTWTNNSYRPTPPNTATIQRSVAGGAYTTVATGVNYDGPWVDNSPGVGTNVYRVTIVGQTNGPNPPYAQSNTVTTVVVPLAPTQLSPNGQAVDFTRPVTFTWKHNHGGDGAAQSRFTIRYSSNGGASWTTLANSIVSTSSSYVVPANTLSNGVPYQWQVQTQGIASVGFGPFSASATTTGSTTPNVVITSPEAITTTGRMTVEWTYSQDEGSPQGSWTASLSDISDPGNEKIVGYKTGTSETSYEFPTRLIDGHTYRVALQVTSGQGVSTLVLSVDTEVHFPVPAPVNLDAEYQPCSGTILLQMTPNEVSASKSVINLATNPSGEVSTDGWFGGFNSMSISQDTTASVSGTSSIKGTPSGTDGDATLLLSVGGLTVGTDYTAIFRVKASKVATLSLGVYFGAAQLATVGTTFQYVRVTFTASQTSHGIGVTGAPNLDFQPGDYVYVDSVMVTEGADAPESGYFDGDSSGFNGWTFEWSGTPHASTSIASKDGDAPVIAATVERSVDGGETWTTLATEVSVPTSLLDILPVTKGLNLYRVTSVSAMGTYYINDTVLVYTPSGSSGSLTVPFYLPSALDGGVSGFVDPYQWAFLSWGPSFANVLRTRSNLSISDSTERNRTAHSFLGRRYPVGFLGDSVTEGVSASATLYYEDMTGCHSDDPCRFDSAPEEWREAARESTLVCFRDYTGRRVFGILDGSLSIDSGHPGMGQLSFKVERVDYTETYGEPVLVGVEE